MFLPAEITTEILSRLPIESVVACKRVCKTWRSLIDEPTFGDTHTRNHLLRVDHSNSDDDDAAAVTSLFFVVTKIQYPDPWPPRPYAITYEFQCGNYIRNAADQMGGGFKISKPPLNIIISNKPDSLMWNWNMIGSSNGLICLSSDKGVYVCNPFTSEYVNLGHPRFKTSPDHIRYNLYGRGFGYHPSTNEYKVVFIYYSPIDVESGKSMKVTSAIGGTARLQLVGEVSVCTLGSGGTWRATEEEALSHTHRCVHTCGGGTPGVLMSGALHWTRATTNTTNTTNTPDGTDYYEIVSFDLAEEKFRSNTIIMPSVPPAATPCAFQLGLLGGCLCITQHNQDSSSSDIWVMNNRDKSWTMKFKISQKDDWRHINRDPNSVCLGYTDYSSYNPIALLGKNRLLLCGKKTGGIVLYDIESGDIDYDNHIMADGYQYSSHVFLNIRYGAIPYVRSIVSLKALGEEGAKKTTLLLQPTPNKPMDDPPVPSADRPVRDRLTIGLWSRLGKCFR